MGSPDGFAYRNKLELSFGTRQFFDEAEHSRGDVQVEGHFGDAPLGLVFQNCAGSKLCLGQRPLNQILKTLQELELKPAWNNHTHTGACVMWSCVRETAYGLPWPPFRSPSD